jgi:excisionase family DNA binding protein
MKQALQTSNWEPQLMMVTDVANLLKVSPKTVYQWAELKLIPSFKLNGAVRFDAKDILDWIQSCRQKSGSCYNNTSKLEAQKGGQNH